MLVTTTITLLLIELNRKLKIAMNLTFMAIFYAHIRKALWL